MPGARYRMILENETKMAIEVATLWEEDETSGEEFVQELLEITLDARTSVWPPRKKSVESTSSKTSVELATASGSATRKRQTTLDFGMCRLR